MTNLYNDPEYWERKRKAGKSNQSPPQTESSEPQPDPTWDYAGIWPNICDLAKLSQDLKLFLTDIEDATPASDEELRARLALLQGLVSHTLAKLEPEGEGKK